MGYETEPRERRAMELDVFVCVCMLVAKGGDREESVYMYSDPLATYVC